MKNKRKDRGLLSLEASIALTIFIFLMLFLYSFFVIFEARNVMAHVVLSTTDSMSLDVFSNKELGESGNISQILYSLYGKNTASGFIDYNQWYEKNGKQISGSSHGGSTTNDIFMETVKTRFISYLTGGNKDEADKILRKYHVKDGVNGLDFSGSKVDEGKLYIKLIYELEYEFNVFGQPTLKMEQSCCSKLWKDERE